MSVMELPSALQRVRLGAGALRHLPVELDRLEATCVLLLASRSLARDTDLVAQVRELLGHRLLPEVPTIRGHTPAEDVAAAEAAARFSGADALVSLGGGAVVDAAKHVVWRLSRELEEPPVAHVAVPTTLSGAEFTHLAGITVDGVKTGVGAMALVPDAALLDPAVASKTPRRLWAWTGVRAVDTAIEGHLQARDAEVATRCRKGLGLLVENLPASARDAEDLDAAARSFEGGWLASIGTLEADAARGPSHVLGKSLGATYGIQHGLTSALTLPLVLDWWASRDPEGVARVAGAFEPGASASDAAGLLEAWLDELGIERPRLRDLGVPREALDEIQGKLLGPVDGTLLERVAELW